MEIKNNEVYSNLGLDYMINILISVYYDLLNGITALKETFKLAHCRDLQERGDQSFATPNKYSGVNPPPPPPRRKFYYPWD